MTVKEAKLNLGTPATEMLEAYRAFVQKAEFVARVLAEIHGELAPDVKEVCRYVERWQQQFPDESKVFTDILLGWSHNMVTLCRQMEKTV